VLVFEDLHWADEAMLAFLEHLADRAEAVSLVVIGTARPELFERHPDYANGLRNTTNINLAPLSEQETARLLSALLDASVLPAELQQPILERAGGNPLYAEEFVRLLKDKDLLVQKGSSWELREGADVVFPDSIQALIAARLDTLTPDTKSLLADAAVIGKVFWAGALAEMGERDLNQVIETLRELSRKELVRPARRSSMEGEAEYAFWHVLARDVAYAQLPRASRAARHVAAARWIESKAPERIEDLADVLAYHYATALELARAAGQTAQASELEAPALRFLSLAGERALGLDTASALANLDRALALTPVGHPARPEALALFGEAALHSARATDAITALEEAIETFRSRGDRVAAARSIGLLTLARQNLNQPGQGELAAEALELLESLPPSAELVYAIGHVSSMASFEGRPEEGAALAARALMLSEELGLSRQVGLFSRAIARSGMGDPRCVEDGRDALALAIRSGQGRAAAALYYNMGQDLWSFQGPRVALETLRDGASFAEARGLDEMVLHLRAGMLGPMLDIGALAAILELVPGLRRDAEAADDELALLMVLSVELLALTLLGESAEADILDRLRSSAQRSGRADIEVLPLSALALSHSSSGDDEGVMRVLGEIEDIPGIEGVIELPAVLPALARAAIGAGHLDAASRLGDRLTSRFPYAEHALVAANAAITEAGGDPQAAADAFADAAERWERFGVVPERAFALLGQGRCLVGVSRPTEAAPVLQHAREIFERLRAAPALAETDELLARATALSS
jgi:hypothetical protein